MLARLQEAVLSGKHERGVTTSLADELLAEREKDASPHPAAEFEADAGPRTR